MGISVVILSPARMNVMYLLLFFIVSVRSQIKSDFSEQLESPENIEEKTYLDSNHLTDEKESRHLGLLGLGSGYGCLQLLSYIRVLKLQLLYYSRALQLSSLGYGGLGLGGAWRTERSGHLQHRDDYGDYQDADVPEYIDQYQYQS